MLTRPIKKPIFKVFELCNKRLPHDLINIDSKELCEKVSFSVKKNHFVIELLSPLKKRFICQLMTSVVKAKLSKSEATAFRKSTALKKSEL